MFPIWAVGSGLGVRQKQKKVGPTGAVYLNWGVNGNGPLLQLIQPQGASTPFAYTEAPELFQCHTIRPSLAHGNCLYNVVKMSIGSSDHFDLFFFNSHISLATVKVQLDECIFDLFLDKHERQWKVYKYLSIIIAH
ncbi:Uncharacterized protein Fot_23926 [Forsythia ovata]|uniref:Uncharacterized protein n=1 Tax=Forsythia ovata TaxID=205694 RepID=A0ABD1U4S5_9LAMI